MFPLEKDADIRRHYTNVLKQALFLQSGSSRAGMTLAKENQNRLWQALKASEYRQLCIGKYRSDQRSAWCVFFRAGAHVVE